jgi:hypothetical protein
VCDVWQQAENRQLPYLKSTGLSSYYPLEIVFSVVGDLHLILLEDTSTM